MKFYFGTQKISKTPFEKAIYVCDVHFYTHAIGDNIEEHLFYLFDELKQHEVVTEDVLLSFLSGKSKEVAYKQSVHIHTQGMTTIYTENIEKI